MSLHDFLSALDSAPPPDIDPEPVLPIKKPASLVKFQQSLGVKKVAKPAEQQLDISKLTLSTEQLELAKQIEETGDHFFVTGKAGTGKSVLLQYIKQTSKKKLVVCAPTGVAALNVGGQTIHSLFKLPPQFIPKNSARLDPKTATLLSKLDMLIIDEISMVRVDVMEAIDSLLRIARMNNTPFGGVQMVLFGDMYQLPPVVMDPELHRYFIEHNEGFYFFNAAAWKSCALNISELSEIFRQTDSEFKTILNSIRVGRITNEVLELLNSRVGHVPPENGLITLASTNATVMGINTSHLSNLDNPERVYKAIIKGKLEPSSFPTDDLLHLKVGAQVMFMKNDKDKRWVNGMIGTVAELADNEIKVTVGELTLTVERETWEKTKYEYDTGSAAITSEPISSFTQFPLRLAWAITIHKSQGQSYSLVSVDLGSGAFAHGQSYVALSRCRTLEGLYLKRPVSRRDIIVDPAIVQFMGGEMWDEYGDV